mgnify:CR=1 FL=1
MGYREDGKWWVSPANYEAEVTKTFSFAPKIEILDTTLRDGEQQPGIIFTKEDKVAIAKKLDEVGVHRIEAGTPAGSQEDADAIMLSSLSGAHNTLFPRVMEELKKRHMTDILVLGGGIIPQDDIPALKAAGISEIYGPGTETGTIIAYVREHLKK